MARLSIFDVGLPILMDGPSGGKRPLEIALDYGSPFVRIEMFARPPFRAGS
jgi:hypothetical protein